MNRLLRLSNDRPHKKNTHSWTLRVAVTVVAALLTPLSAQAESKASTLEYRYTEGPQVVIIPLGKESSHADDTQQGPFVKFENLLNKIKGGLKQPDRKPLFIFFEGEYNGGADEYTEGMAYKAEWAQQRLNFELKYRF